MAGHQKVVQLPQMACDYTAPEEGAPQAALGLPWVRDE